MNLRALLALCAIATPAMADPNACVDGAPGMLLLETFQPMQVIRSSASKYQMVGTVTVVDSGGRPLRNREVAFVLPPPPSTATFHDGTRRMLGNTGDSCYQLQTPGIIGPAALGTMAMRVELVSNPNIFRNLDFMVTAPPPNYYLVGSSLLDTPAHLSVTTGMGEFPERITATISADSQNYDIGWSGVPLTFSLPETGPSATFPDGSKSAVVPTDAWGRAIAPTLRGNGVLGGVNVKVSTPSGQSTTMLAFANVGPTVTFQAPAAGFSGPFPGYIWTDATVTFQGYPCAPTPGTTWGPVQPRFVVRADGKPFAGGIEYSSSGYDTREHACDGGNYMLRFHSEGAFLSFGRHEISVALEGDGVFQPSEAANKFVVEVTPHAAGMTGVGATPWQAAVIDHGLEFSSGFLYCAMAMSSATPGEQGVPLVRPGFTFPLGAFAYDVSRCSQDRAPGTHRVVLELGRDVPRDARVLWYDAVQSKWVPLPASIEGGRVQFVVTKGGAGDNGSGGPLAIRGFAAIALADPGSAPGNYQDLWWGGAAQNGWGLGIAQHDERMFVTLYAYDDSGAARWWVVPGGSWSTDFRTFTGAIYSPSWSASSKLVAGPPVGSMSLAFRDDGKATMRYDIDGRTGERTIERQSIAAPDAGVHWNAADMWWRGPEWNGLGTFIAQQGRELFVVNYQYDYYGKTTWNVIPSGEWWRVDRYAATGWYETTGASFFAYDPAALKAYRRNQARIDFSAPEKAKLHLGCFVWSTDDWGCIDYEIVRQPF